MKWGLREVATLVGILGVMVPATLALGQSFLVAPVDARLTTHIAVQQSDTASLAREIQEMRVKIDAVHHACVRRGECPSPGGH